MSSSFPLDEKILACTDTERALLGEAFILAQEAHKGQMRKTGEPYFTHPFAVATMLWKRFNNIELACAALLHDVVEDCDVTRETLYEQFGDEIGFLVDAVTKNSSDFYREPGTNYCKVQKVLYGGMRDVRVFVLKLADRDDNLKTLRSLKNGKQVRIAFETYAIYAPLNDALGYANTELTLKELQVHFENDVPAAHRVTPAALKEYLLAQSLTQVDAALYDAIYSDSGSPLWTITDWEMYKRITEDEDLSSQIDFVSIEGNDKEFVALFQFTGGALLKGAKFGIAGYSG